MANPTYKPLDQYTPEEIAANRQDAATWAAEHPGEGGLHAPGVCPCYPGCYQQADREEAAEAERDLWTLNTAKLTGVWPMPR